MSDHLTDARTCVTHASKARDAGSAISWLTDACKQIIAYLESQQAPPAAQQGDGGPWTPDTEDVEFCLDYLEAQRTAPQPKPRHRDGDEAERAAEAAARAGWEAWAAETIDPDEDDTRLSWDELDDKTRADLVTHERIAIAAAEPYIRAQALREAVASLRAKFGPTNRAADYLARAEQTKEDR